MKKAHIILSALILITILGGALAFKANRFNGQPAFTYTDEYSTFGTKYTTVAAVCLPIVPARFISTTGPLTTVYSSTGIMFGVTITLQRIGGTETITFPLWDCVERANTRTTAAN